MPLSAPVVRRLRRAAVAIGAALLLLALAGLLLLSFGWCLLRPLAERRLSAALGRPVRIAGIERVSGGLFHPVLRVSGVAVDQPAWVGPGPMIRLRAAEVRIAALPLLVGRVEPQLTRLSGLRARLVRDAGGRANWEADPSHRTRGSSSPDLGAVRVEDAILWVDDRQHFLRFRLALASDARGFRVDGPGTIAGSSARFTLAGPAVGGKQAWPFRATVRSGRVTLVANGRMKKPLDVGHMAGRVESHGDNFADLGPVIQTGLPDTQPFHLTAAVSHDQPNWRVSDLAGRLGRSAVRGNLEIGRQDPTRTFLKGSLVSTGFDFDDLATDAQRAVAARQERRTGPRLIPSTRIDLSKLRTLDGELHIDAHRLLSRTPTVFRSLKATLTLDHGVLTVASARAGLVSGEVAGTAVVRHQTGRPLLLLNLRLTGGRLEKLAHTGGVLAGPVAGHLVLRGYGETVAAAMGRGSGRIGMASRGGEITRRVALFLGADVGRGLFEGNSERTGLRCLVADFAVRNGVARPDPLVVDTDVARADGRGRILLATERVDLQLTGAPKKNSALRLNGPIEAGGTLEQPSFNPPPQTKTVGGILKMVGRALGGPRQPLATDADCAALAARALR